MEGNCLLDDLGHEFRPAEDVDDIDLFRYVAQACIGLLAQGTFDLWIDRNNTIALGLQVGGNAVARAHWARRKTNYSDGAGVLQKFGDMVGFALTHDAIVWQGLPVGR